MILHSDGTTKPGRSYTTFDVINEAKLPVCGFQQVGAAEPEIGARFWTYGLIHLLDPSGANVVSRPQTPRSKLFLRFHDFIG